MLHKSCLRPVTLLVPAQLEGPPLFMNGILRISIEKVHKYNEMSFYCHTCKEEVKKEDLIFRCHRCGEVFSVDKVKINGQAYVCEECQKHYNVEFHPIILEE